MGLEKHWSETVFDLILDQDISLVSFVPDAGLSQLIDLCVAHDAVQTVRLTSEEEGVSLAMGSWLGGKKACYLCSQVVSVIASICCLC